ncbi:MAG: hypothetical protein JSW58_04070 [Candidatus Latescibacterota bacterium]|nr:MAG: hypothetical protein JSW58_04070 [Candidatus Latescibacterota bacterium]
MTKRRLLTPGVVILAFALLLPVGCSDDGAGPGDGNGNGTPGNPVAEAFKAIADGTDAILTEHEELFASLEFFVGEIGITSNASPNMSDAVRASCIPVSKQGKVFTWDGSNGYTGVDSSMAPPEGAIYVLYRVVNGELETPPVEIGYVEANCVTHESQPPVADDLSVTLFRKEGPLHTEVAHIDFKGLFYDPTYYFQRSQGTLMGGGVELKIEVWGEGEVGSTSYIKESLEIDLYESFQIPLLENSDAGIGLWDYTLDSRGMPTPGFYDYGVGANKSRVFHCGVRISVADATGIISNINGGEKAPLEFEAEGGTNGILACFSGKFDDAESLTVEASDVDGGCATGVIETPIPLEAGDLAHIKSGYLKMWRMFNSAITPLWVASVNIVMTP